MFHDCLDDDGKCCNMCDFKAGIVGMDLLQTWQLKYTQTKVLTALQYNTSVLTAYFQLNMG